MAKLIICFVIFLGGYLVGTWDGTEGMSIGRYARIIVNIIAAGCAIGVSVALCYIAYLSSVRKKLNAKNKKLMEVQADFQRQEEIFQEEKKRFWEECEQEKKKCLTVAVQNVEERIKRHGHIEAAFNLDKQSKQLHNQIEAKFRAEMERILKGRSVDIQNEKPIKKVTSNKKAIYIASDGIYYTRLREGPPIKRIQ
jgi:ABC-type lipoprotein release transport system permease subunit